ncbi:MAG: acetyl-CoA C-acetyltransferase [Thermoproteota archaeon]|jgi:acetyl-CoA C-acetyltransferase
MSESIKRVAIIGGSRIPFCRSVGPYKRSSNQEMMTAALDGLIKRLGLDDKPVDELVLGAVLKHTKDFNLARNCAVTSGLSYSTVCHDIQQACGTSLQAAILVANKIALGQIDSGIAGGVDTSSDVPIELSTSLAQTLVQLSKARSVGARIKLLSKLRPRDILPILPANKEYGTGLSMGEHCEKMAQEWNISRSEQDELAFNSHQNAEKSFASGFHDELVVEFEGIKKDNNIRSTTTIEKLNSLRAAFDKGAHGTLTAGNSSPLTDGAACVFLCSEEYAKENNLEIESYLTFSQSAAIDYQNEEGLLMAPAYAVPKILKQAKCSLQDFDFYEIHEAFAAQVLCTLKAWNDEDFCKSRLGLEESLGEIDTKKLNVNGSSLAYGHPFAATGARIIANASKLLKEKGSGKCLISLCTAGGMGVTAIIERP